MLTDTMTPDETLREMRGDYERLCRRLNHEMPRWRRWLLKHKGMMRIESSEWTSPQTRNRWVWGARLTDPKMNHLGLLSGVLRWHEEGMSFILLWPDGGDKERYTGFRSSMSDIIGGHDMLVEVTPHCWQRIRERWTGMRRWYGADLVQQVFFLNDSKYIAMSTTDEGQNRAGRRIANPARIVLPDGILLGEQLKPWYMRMNTFITHDQTYGQQREVLGDLKDKMARAEPLI